MLQIRDIYTTRIVMKNSNPLNKPNEAIPEVNPVVPEPNQVVDIHDPNEMVDIPDEVDLVDYDGDDEENSEEDPEEELEPNNGLVNQFAPHVNRHQPGVMSNALTSKSFNSATSDETAGVEELVPTLAMTALLSIILRHSLGILSKKLPPAAEFNES
ncbi:hypothetical protein Tco_0288285 [Tanacetum coccineum]